MKIALRNAGRYFLPDRVNTSGMVVQHNMNALNAYNKLNTNVSGLKKSSEKLSSGYRINRAGDDAAGLAISEKMRSQIRGLTQAKRNSQDGISMIQTYEGAAQESHSILQRMKELATESANGTYQNEVDRDAIQLEFNQLNDELNQIADTDFNGVVMLNGGQMADGTKAVNNKFDYVDGTVAASKLGKSDVNVLDGQVYNNDNIADAFWTSLNSQWNRTDTDTSNDGPNSVDITFKYDKSSETWSAVSASDGANYKNVTVKDNGNGGFSVTLETPTYTWTDKDGADHIVMSDETFYENATDGSIISKEEYDKLGAVAQGDYKAINPTAGDPLVADLANVVVDESKLANGDTVTLTFTNPASGISAPENAGATVADSSNITEVIGAEKAKDLDLSVELGAGFTDATMTEDINSLIKQLDGASVTVSYDATDNGTKDAEIGYSMSIALNDGTVIKSGADGDETALSINDTTFSFKWTDDGAGTLNMTVSVDGQDLFTISPTQMVGVAGTDADANTTTTFSTGSIEYKLGIENYKYDAGAVPSVEVAKTGSVSKANSNNSATAPLTYTDHLVLQTGARTKDSVDFTFEYSTEGMGDLQANLNISSRADGLNTANLSLATQEDANYAIDRIDNAINKVSMVRATFGATQNRLEHKIENLTTTNENLTEAESGIRDTDMASEMLNYTKYNVLQQAAQSMLAQANQQPQSILQLLG